MKVKDLQSGMLINQGGVSATFITSSWHPLAPGFMMVVWVMEDSHPGFGEAWGRVSIDCLSPEQDVGGADPHLNKMPMRIARLREVLMPGDV